MSDPCDEPNSYRSNTLTGLGGTFSYNVPEAIPPGIFGITSYDITILPEGTSSSIYNVFYNSNEIMKFSVQRVQPYKFINIPVIGNPNYLASIVQDDDVLVIERGNLRWRIGTGLLFSSCLTIRDYILCNSGDRVPVSQPSSFFRFSCPSLPTSAQVLGFNSYTLRLDYGPVANEYGVYLNPISAKTNFVPVGGFAFSSNTFSNPFSEPGYIIDIIDNKVVVYAQKARTPIWTIYSNQGNLLLASINAYAKFCTEYITPYESNVKRLVFLCSPLTTAIRQKSDFGLNSFDMLIRILSFNGENITSTAITLDFIQPSAQIISTYNDGTSPITVTGGPPQIRIRDVTNNEFSIQIPSSDNNTKFIFYTVKYADDVVTVTLEANFRNMLDGSFLAPGPGEVPNIFAKIEATPDGQEICVLNFVVTEQNRTRTYRQYCTSFTAVICAPGCRKGCTLRQKLESLQLGEDFVQYFVLRYILSALLDIKPFNNFNIQLLRQRYNDDFLTNLAETEYRTFLPTLTANPEFATYFYC